MKPKTLLPVFVLLALVAAAQQEVDFARPQSYVSRARQQGNVLDLSHQETIERALTGNLDITIENYAQDINLQRLIGAQGFYDPMLDFSLNQTSSDTPTSSILQGGEGIAVENNRNRSFGPSLRQNIPGGGSVNFSFNNARATTNSTFSFINPLFSSNLDITFTQPLWRGFLQNPADRQIKIIHLDNEINDSQFHLKVAEIVQRVRNQYWDLVGAIETYETRRQSMELAITQYENTAQRVQSGLLSPVALTSSRAEVAIREQAMIQSEVQIIRAQNELKRLIAPDPGADIWNATLIPTDLPQMQDLTITLEEAIRTALERRPELEQLMLRVQQNQVDRKFLKKETKPRVDLRLNAGSVGRAGTVFAPSGNPDSTEPVLDRENPGFGGLSSAWGQVFGFDFPNWGLAVSVQIPFRNRTNEAQLAQTQISDRRLQSQMKNAQQAIIVEVRNSYEGISTQKKNLEAARLATQLSEEQLRGATARFEAGFSTNFEVLRYQRDLAEARVRELRALIDYQSALTALEKAMDVIVDANDIVIARQK